MCMNKLTERLHSFDNWSLLCIWINGIDFSILIEEKLVTFLFSIFVTHENFHAATEANQIIHFFYSLHHLYTYKVSNRRLCR